MTDVTIYVFLPEEAVDCWYPARARKMDEDAYLLIDPSPEDPVLEFSQGDVVRCRLQGFADGMPGTLELVAYERISEFGPSIARDALS